jgi:hypothetical protein
MIHIQLGKSRLSTERRSHAVERRLERDPDLKFHYNFMKKHEEIDHIEAVTSQQGSIHVTIHHTIQTPRKQVPQDYSCYMEVLKLNELSSNDIQVGATVQQDL